MWPLHPHCLRPPCVYLLSNLASTLRPACVHLSSTHVMDDFPFLHFSVLLWTQPEEEEKKKINSRGFEKGYILITLNHSEAYLITLNHSETYLITLNRSETYLITLNHSEAYLITLNHSETYLITLDHSESYLITLDHSETYLITSILNHTKSFWSHLISLNHSK